MVYTVLWCNMLPINLWGEPQRKCTLLLRALHNIRYLEMNPPPPPPIDQSLHHQLKKPLPLLFTTSAKNEVLSFAFRRLFDAETSADVTVISTNSPTGRYRFRTPVYGCHKGGGHRVSRRNPDPMVYLGARRDA